MVFFVKYSAFAQQLHPGKAGELKIIFFDQQTQKTVNPAYKWSDLRAIDDCRIDGHACALKCVINGKFRHIEDRYLGSFLTLEKGEYSISFSGMKFMNENNDLFVANAKPFTVKIDVAGAYALHVPVRRYTKVEIRTDIANDNGIAELVCLKSNKIYEKRPGRFLWLLPGKYDVKYSVEMNECKLYGYIPSLGFPRPSCKPDGSDIYVSYPPAGDAFRMEHTAKENTGFSGPIIFQLGHMNGSAPIIDWEEAEYHNEEVITIPETEKVVYIRVKDF